MGMSVESLYAASQKGALNQHVKAVHKIIRIRNHVCGECGHDDSEKGSLEMHIKQVYLKIRGCISIHDIQKRFVLFSCTD